MEKPKLPGEEQAQRDLEQAAREILAGASPETAKERARSLDILVNGGMEFDEQKSTLPEQK